MRLLRSFERRYGPASSQNYSCRDLAVNILAFDTCFEACSAAIQAEDRGGVTRVSARFEPMAQGHAERLVAMIGEAMAEAGVSFADLDRIGVTTGPGSFTGTRICVAAARAFALAHRVPLVGLSSLAVMAVSAAEQAEGLGSSGRPILVAVDARRGEAYCQMFQPSGLTALSEPRLLPIAEAGDLARMHKAFVPGSAAAAVIEAAGAECGAVAGLPELLPDARCAVILVQSSTGTNRSVAPLYLRPPDAKPPARAAVSLQPAGGGT